MGYSTHYKGTIRIYNLDLERVRILNLYLGKDKREIVQHIPPGEDLPFTFFSVELNEEMTALQWDGAEKTYGMLEMLNFLRLIAQLEFGEGDNMVCQGDEIEDRYILVVENNEVIKRAIISESQGSDVYVTMGSYYDEEEVGGVFADKADAEEYCAKRAAAGELKWIVLTRVLS